MASKTLEQVLAENTRFRASEKSSNFALIPEPGAAVNIAMQILKNYKIPLLVLAAIAVLYSFRLGFPSTQYYDEVYHVKTAREFLTLSGNTDSVHPPLNKMIVAAGIKVFGDKSWVWRLFPCLFGIGTFIIFYFLSLRIFKSSHWALVAAAMWALDGMSITQARITMHNTAMTFFMLTTLLFFVRSLESSKNHLANAIGCGLFLGLTAASRWVGLGILAVMGLLLLNKERLQFQKWRWLDIAAAMAAAVLIYAASHIILLFIFKFQWKDIWQYQINMWSYHAHLKEGHGYGSEWWTWLFMIRPIWYFFENHAGTIYGIFCIGNPAVFWFGTPALLYLLWRFWKKRSWESAFILAGFFSQWLPWAFISRVKFFHYFYTAMPFLILAVTLTLKDIWDLGNEKRILVGIYLALVIVLFIYWYPLLTGYPISEAYFQKHLWFKRWI